MFLPDYPTSAEHVVSLNWFAVALSYFRLHDEARPLLARIGDRPTIDPWSYFEPNVSRVLHEYRTNAGLPPLAG